MDRTLGTIRLGTRGSKLAMWQANWTASSLRERGFEVEIVVIKTRGDISTQSLSVVGGQGVFTKEIQRELLAGNVDLAVHSLKDLPTIAVEGLTLASVPERESVDDCLISRSGEGFAQLPAGARVGTGSSRRAAQLRAWRSDVEIADIRGNVDSRLVKLDAGEYDAIVLAAAGLTRLELTSRITERLPAERILPAIGQGALGLECRADDEFTKSAAATLSDARTYACVHAERSLLQSLMAGCMAPVAALGTVDSTSRLTLKARVLSPDGLHVLEAEAQDHMDCAEQLGVQLAEQLKQNGALELIATARQQS